MAVGGLGRAQEILRPRVHHPRWTKEEIAFSLVSTEQENPSVEGIYFLEESVCVWGEPHQLEPYPSGFLGDFASALLPWKILVSHSTKEAAEVFSLYTIR